MVEIISPSEFSIQDNLVDEKEDLWDVNTLLIKLANLQYMPYAFALKTMTDNLNETVEGINNAEILLQNMVDSFEAYNKIQDEKEQLSTLIKIKNCVCNSLSKCPFLNRFISTPEQVNCFEEALSLKDKLEDYHKNE